MNEYLLCTGILSLNTRYKVVVNGNIGPAEIELLKKRLIIDVQALAIGADEVNWQERMDAQNAENVAETKLIKDAFQDELEKDQDDV